jgi:hypothetical protein
MPFSTDGQLCIDTGTVTSPTYINGKAVGAKGLYAFAYTEFVATATNLLPAGWTLTRASTGTYFDSAGLLQTAAIDAARGTYRYNGSAWVFDGTIVEAAATNSLLRSRALGTAPWVGTGTAGAQNATGIDGAANTAWTLTDASAVAFDGYYQAGSITVANDSNSHAVSVRILKDGNTTTFPSLYAVLGGGTGVTVAAVINTSTGAFTAQQLSGTGGGSVVDEGLWWKLTVYVNNNSTGNTILAVQMYPAYTTGTTASASTVAAQRSCVVDQFDHRPNSTVTDSPIITADVAVTRAADVLTAPTAGLLVNGQGFAAARFRAISVPSTGFNQSVIGSSGVGEGIPLYFSANASPSELAVFDVTAARLFGTSAQIPSAGTVCFVATTWAGSSCQGAKNGVTGSAQTFDTSMNLGATLQIGDAFGGAMPYSMVLQSLRLGLTAASSAQLTTFTT